MAELESADEVTRRRIIQGAGMLECVRTFVFAGERYIARVTRIAPEWLRDHPHLAAYFRPLDAAARADYLRLTRRDHERRPGALPAPAAGGGEARRL
jgi:hypothetical protein